MVVCGCVWCVWRLAGSHKPHKPPTAHLSRCVAAWTLLALMLLIILPHGLQAVLLLPDSEPWPGLGQAFYVNQNQWTHKS